MIPQSSQSRAQMHKFKDNKDREYVLTITLGQCREIRAKLGVDATSPQDLPELIDSLATRLAFVWYLIEPQAQKLGIGVAEWEEAMAGEGVADACSDTLHEALADFTQRYGMTGPSKLLRTALKGQQEMRAKAKTPEFDQQLTETMRKLVAGL